MTRAKRTKHPKHEVTFEVMEARLDVSAALGAKLHGWLDLLHPLREALVRERADNRAEQRQVLVAGGTPAYTTQADQYRRITALVAADPRYRAVHSQVLQDVAVRVERGTKSWLKGNTGPLKPSPRKKYHSFTFTQYGFAAKIRAGRLHLSKLGDARLVGLRRLPGRIKAVTLTFKQGHWFAQFLCEAQTQHCARNIRNASYEVSQLPDTGLDTGLARICTLADGVVFVPAKPLKEALPQLRREQRRMSRQFEARKKVFAAYRADFKALGLHGPLPEKNHFALSGRLLRQIRRVAILHTKVECTRKDQLRKVARQIEQNYRCVAVEEHGVEFMKKNRRTSRAVSDVAPGLFKGLLKRALGGEDSGRYVAVGTVRPGIGGNSQTCLCGAPVPKTLKDRWHLCPVCALSADRDEVSSNIAMDTAFGYSVLGATKPPGPGQGTVRRGERKGRFGQPKPAACGRISVHATEPSGKRQSSADRRSACTAGAQATAGVNNLLLLKGAPSARLERLRRQNTPSSP